MTKGEIKLEKADSSDNQSIHEIKQNAEALELTEKQCIKEVDGKEDITRGMISNLEASLVETSKNSAFLDSAKEAVEYQKTWDKISSTITEATQRAKEQIALLFRKREQQNLFSEDDFRKLIDQEKSKQAIGQGFGNPAIGQKIESLLSAGKLEDADRAIQMTEMTGLSTYQHKVKLITLLCEQGSFDFALGKISEGKGVETKLIQIVVNKSVENNRLNDPKVIDLIKRLNYLPDGRRNHIPKEIAGEFLKTIILNTPTLEGDIPDEALQFIYDGLSDLDLNDTDEFSRSERVSPEHTQKSFEKFARDIREQFTRMKQPKSGEFRAMRDMLRTEQLVEAQFYNLKAMRELEEKSPGSVTKLYDEFGIRNYQRYPSEMLLTQLEEKDEDIPYGVILQAVSDYNGNFSRDRQLYGKLLADLKDNGYTLRISEATEKKELAVNLHNLDKKYGQKNKIDFLVLGGHGQAGEIQLGESGKDHKDKLTTADLDNPVISKLNTYLNPDASIVMNSCLTGGDVKIDDERKQGLAQSISRVAGKEVTASTELISGPQFTVQKVNGKIKVGAIYTLGEEGNVNYKDGQKV